MGLGNKRFRPLSHDDSWSLWTAITIAVAIIVCPKVSGREKTQAIFDDLGLPSLELGVRPDLRYLSAQGNRFQRLDISGTPRLDRLLLFDNRFDRRGTEALFFDLVSHGKREGFLGLNDIRKQTLSLGGRMSLATLRSRD